MKVQFKYAFRAGLSPRLTVLCVITLLNLAFIVPGVLGVLPLAAQIVGVSLSGCAIAVMLVFNVLGDISIMNNTFSAKAVIFALTPVHRGKTLAANAISMLIMDFVSMAIAICGTVLLAINVGNNFADVNTWGMMYYAELPWGVSPVFLARNIILPLLIFVAAYLSIVMTAFFSIALRKSVLYSVPAGGFLASLIAVAIVYITNLLNLLLIPFGSVNRFYFMFNINLGYLGMGMYALLLFIVAAVLFVLTSRILEKKINI